MRIFQLDERPHHSNCGQGGALAQLAAVAEWIHPDLNPDKVKQSKTKAIPTDMPINAMAPPEKQHRGLCHKVLFFLYLLM